MAVGCLPGSCKVEMVPRSRKWARHARQGSTPKFPPSKEDHYSVQVGQRTIICDGHSPKAIVLRPKQKAARQILCITRGLVFQNSKDIPASTLGTIQIAHDLITCVLCRRTKHKKFQQNKCRCLPMNTVPSHTSFHFIPPSMDPRNDSNAFQYGICACKTSTPMQR